MTNRREEIARELQDKYENKIYYSMKDPKTPILINKYKNIADWHIKEIEKAKAETRIDVAKNFFRHEAVGDYDPR